MNSWTARTLAAVRRYLGTEDLSSVPRPRLVAAIREVEGAHTLTLSQVSAVVDVAYDRPRSPAGAVLARGGEPPEWDRAQAPATLKAWLLEDPDLSAREACARARLELGYNGTHNSFQKTYWLDARKAVQAEGVELPSQPRRYRAGTPPRRAVEAEGWREAVDRVQARPMGTLEVLQDDGPRISIQKIPGGRVRLEFAVDVELDRLGELLAATGGVR